MSDPDERATSPGLYLVNATGDLTPLATDDGSGDRQLLDEVLEDLDDTDEDRDHPDRHPTEAERTCRECGDRLATDADHGWVCLSCGEPRELTPETPTETVDVPVDLLEAVVECADGDISPPPSVADRARAFLEDGGRHE